MWSRAIMRDEYFNTDKTVDVAKISYFESTISSFSRARSMRSPISLLVHNFCQPLLRGRTFSCTDTPIDTSIGNPANCNLLRIHGEGCIFRYFGAVVHRAIKGEERGTNPSTRAAERTVPIWNGHSNCVRTHSQEHSSSKVYSKVMCSLRRLKVEEFLEFDPRCQSPPKHALPQLDKPRSLSAVFLSGGWRSHGQHPDKQGVQEHENHLPIGGRGDDIIWCQILTIVKILSLLPQISMYGKCVLVHKDGIERDACQTEFQALKSCFRKVNPLAYPDVSRMRRQFEFCTAYCRFAKLENKMTALNGIGPWHREIDRPQSEFVAPISTMRSLFSEKR